MSAKNRIRATKEQRKVLIKLFDSTTDGRPSLEEYAQVEQATGLEHKWVSAWFSRYCRQRKKQSQADNATSSTQQAPVKIEPEQCVLPLPAECKLENRNDNLRSAKTEIEEVSIPSNNNILAVKVEIAEATILPSSRVPSPHISTLSDRTSIKGTTTTPNFRPEIPTTLQREHSYIVGPEDLFFTSQSIRPNSSKLDFKGNVDQPQSQWEHPTNASSFAPFSQYPKIPPSPQQQYSTTNYIPHVMSQLQPRTSYQPLPQYPNFPNALNQSRLYASPSHQPLIPLAHDEIASFQARHALNARYQNSTPAPYQPGFTDVISYAPSSYTRPLEELPMLPPVSVDYNVPLIESTNIVPDGVLSDPFNSRMTPLQHLHVLEPLLSVNNENRDQVMDYLLNEKLAEDDAFQAAMGLVWLQRVGMI
ncbi:hypothetical protein GYMLUDRAFT_518473 [Collybiopsis luxurians FD-317 M1]|nr:hypothetical protein GYMLUDRAFT_518473 [Collybiopsis luxurians FD-317 M1]